MLREFKFIKSLHLHYLCKEDAFNAFMNMKEYHTNREYDVRYNFISTYYEIYEILPK